MKNFEIMVRSGLSLRVLLRRRRAQLGVDLLARDRAHDTADDNAVVLGDALLNHAQFALQRARFDPALLDSVVLVDHEHITPALIAAERYIGNQQRRLRPRRYPNAYEIAGEQMRSAFCKVARAASVPVEGSTVGAT